MQKPCHLTCFNEDLHDFASTELRCGLYLFGDGLAVQFVVDFSDFGHGESRNGESVEAE